MCGSKCASSVRLEGKYLQKTYILQLGSVSQLVNVHHVRSLHMHHQIPGVSKRRLTVDTVQPLGPSTFTIWSSRHRRST